jgi:hypothetical protein
MTVEAEPAAVVAATTTWPELPSLRGTLLDEVWTVIRAGGVERAGHDVMLYEDDVPHVEVGVQVTGPFARSGGWSRRRCRPAGSPRPSTGGCAPGPVRPTRPVPPPGRRAQGHALGRVRWEIYGDDTDDPAAVETEVRRRLA